MTQIAKLFQNGRSQAVRLPAEFRFAQKEVYIRRDPIFRDFLTILRLKVVPPRTLPPRTTGPGYAQATRTADPWPAADPPARPRTVDSARATH